MTLAYDAWEWKGLPVIVKVWCILQSQSSGTYKKEAVLAPDFENTVATNYSVLGPKENKDKNAKVQSVSWSMSLSIPSHRNSTFKWHVFYIKLGFSPFAQHASATNSLSEPHGLHRVGICSIRGSLTRLQNADVSWALPLEGKHF